MNAARDSQAPEHSDGPDAEVAQTDQEQPAPKPSENTRTVLLRIEQELDSASAFEMADLTAVEVEALIRRLRAHGDLRKARFRLARRAKMQPHRMQIACALRGRTVVLSLLAPSDKDQSSVIELLPLARAIEDEWHARDLRAQSQTAEVDTTNRSESPGTESPEPPKSSGSAASGSAPEETPKPEGAADHPERNEPAPKQPPGHVTVTYSVGGEPPRHPPLTLPPAAPRPSSSYTRSKERAMVCEIFRPTAAGRCLIKEAGTTRLRETTFSTSTDLPLFLNMLPGFPAVVLKVQDYLPADANTPPPYAFHIVDLIGLSEEWDQQVSLIEPLQRCVDKLAQMQKRLKADRQKSRKVK